MASLKIAKWDSNSTKILLDICIEEIRTIERPRIAFKSKKWEEIRDEFNKRTSKEYTQKQLKNRIDTMRDNWSTWKQLMGKETGLGWNHHTGTFEADATWWEAKIRDNPNYKKFRYQGLEFVEELRFIFGESVATSEVAWTPAIGVPTEHIDLEVPIEDEVNDMEINLDEESPQGNKRRKVTQDVADKVAKGKSKVGTATAMRKFFKKLVEAAVSNNEIQKEELAATSHFHGKYSIPNCVKMLKSLKEMKLLNGGQFLYALKLIKLSENRAIFMSLKDDTDALVEWLLDEYGN